MGTAADRCVWTDLVEAEDSGWSSSFGLVLVVLAGASVLVLAYLDIGAVLSGFGKEAYMEL